MSNDLTPPGPQRFGLASFAELLPGRDPVLGEDPGAFDGFHEGMMRALVPFTPYECVVAENLVTIEWELVQHRRMQVAGLRREIKEVLSRAVEAALRAQHERVLDASWDAHIAAGGDADAWEEPVKFDHDEAVATAADLADRGTSADPAVYEAAREELLALGVDLVEVMSKAYRDTGGPVSHHDRKVQELERRRREVKRDYDLLQKARPIEGEVIDG